MSQTHDLADGGLFCLSRAFGHGQSQLNSPGCFHVSGSLITEADPVVWIAIQLLEELHLHPQVTTFEVVYRCTESADCPIGDVIRVTDMAGRHVVYVITRLASAALLVYEARWPD